MTNHEATEQAYRKGYDAGVKCVSGLVLCKNCKNWEPTQCADGYGWCDKVSAFKPGEWYCADGENKHGQR